MNKYRHRLATFSAFFLILSGSVMADGDDGSRKDIEPQHKAHNNSGYSKIVRMASEMGGLEKILALKTTQFLASGSRHEPEQSKKPGGDFVHILDYRYNLINGLSKPVSKTEWFHDANYPFIEQRQFSEIINGEQGAVFGFDTIIAPPQAPMLSTRLGARVKQNLVSSPLAIIHRANQYRWQVKFVGNENYQGRPHQVVRIPGWAQPIHLYIDVASKLPSKAETLEDDAIYGDTRWEVLFSNWMSIEGIKVPTTLSHKINGRIINEETRSAFQLNRDFNPALFTIPDELKTDLNPEQFAWGIRTSQWFNRYLSVGVPFDLDQRTAATLQIIEVANKVYHVRSLTHHSMVIEMDDYLIAVDAPLYNELSETVLTALKNRWPNKPVKYLVLSHFHNDHSGGVRGYGAAGVTLIVGKGTREHFETVFEAPHTIYPDTYASTQNKVKIKTVSTDQDLVLSDGKRRVRIFDVENRHAIGMLVPFIEDVNMIFVSDLYNPDFFPDKIPQRFLSWSGDLLAALAESDLDINWLVGAHGGVSSYEQFVMQVESSLEKGLGTRN